MVQSPNFRVQHHNFRVQSHNFRVQHHNFRVQSPDFRVQRHYFRVQSPDLQRSARYHHRQHPDGQHGGLPPVEGEGSLQQGDAPEPIIFPKGSKTSAEKYTTSRAFRGI